MSSPQTLRVCAARFQRFFVCAAPSGRCLARWGMALLLIVSFAAVPGSAAEKAALPAVDDTWRQYQSPNFELFSQNPENDSRELLYKLELLRAFFLTWFKTSESARLDVSIYYFRKQADFDAYTSENSRQNQLAGFYLARADRAVIALSPARGAEEAQRTIFHEYVHHLFRSSGARPTKWFNEGMAELLSTVRFTPDVVEVGHPAAGRVAALKAQGFLPLDQVFGADRQPQLLRDGQHTGAFYAESWVLLHYWYFGESGFSKDAVDRFLSVAGDQRTIGSADLAELFKSCFGMDYAAMQGQLSHYIEAGQYAYGRRPIPVVADKKSYSTRRLTRDEAQTRLAELALRVERSPAGKFLLLDALSKARVGEAKDPRILETLGTEALADQDPTRAQQLWEEALAAGSRNVAVARELALLDSAPWFRRFDHNFRLPDETAARFRTRLLRAIEQEPTQSAPYEMLAWVEAFANEPVAANVVRVQQHFGALQEKARTLVAFAFLSLRLRSFADAERMLNQMETFYPDEWERTAAQIVRTLLASAQGREAKPAANPSARAASIPVAQRPKALVPSVELPEKYQPK